MRRLKIVIFIQTGFVLSRKMLVFYLPYFTETVKQSKKAVWL